MARWEALTRDSSAYLKKLVESGTDWAYLWGSAESNHFVRRRVRMGVCYVEAFRANGLSSAGTQVGTLPDGYKAANGSLGYLYIHGVSGVTGQLVVDRDGTINAWLSQSSDYCSGQVAFAISNP